MISSGLTSQVLRARQRTYSIAALQLVLPSVFALGFAGAVLPSLAVAVQTQSQVQFDTAGVLVCREMTDEAFLATYPDSRLLEAEFEVSTLHRRVNDDQLEFLIQIFSPRRQIQIVDYSPQTSLASAYDGTIAVETTSEGSTSIGIDAQGSFENIAKLTGQASAGGRIVETEKFQRLPPQELVLASGIMNRGCGVYFKVLPRPDASMQGGRRYTIRFRVPQSWRGELLQLRCEARQSERSGMYRLEADKSYGSARFMVACCIDADPTARRIAERYSAAEFELRRQATLQHEELRRRASANLIDRVGQSIGVSKPRIPADWLHRLIAGDLRSYSEYGRHLPTEIRLASEAWMDARQDLRRLTEGSPVDVTLRDGESTSEVTTPFNADE